MTKGPDKIVFVTDSEARTLQWMCEYFESHQYSTLPLGMKSSPKNRTVNWRRIILFYKYIQTAILSIRKSTASDAIIYTNFIIGAFAAFFCKLFGIKRTIISLNMISHEKGLFNRLVRKIVYNTAFKYPGLYITVNSAELIDNYAAEFKIDRNHFFILFDCIRAHFETAPYTNGNGAVFCGGEAMRDWDSLFKAAQLLPDIKFTVIARKINLDPALVIPGNVTTYFDTDFDFFYQQLKESSIVAMPLTTTAPAGLIVLVRAALLSKPVIITSTSSTRNYVEHKYNGILLEKGDYKSLAGEIEFLMANNSERERLCLNMTESIKKFSVENYLKTIEGIIAQVKK